MKFLLDGSVRRVGDTLRINVQLIDGQTGPNLWAKRYDGSIDDVLTFQDGIIQNIIAILHLQLDPVQQDLQKAAETDNPRAYDAFLQGWEHHNRRTREGFAAALPFLERAIELDPNYGRAYAALAALYWGAYTEWRHGELGLNAAFEARTKAEEYLEKALETPTALSHRVLARLHQRNDQHDAMMREANTVVRLAPNDAESYFWLSWALIVDGQPADAVLAIDKAMALNPRYPPVYLALKGTTYYQLKDYGVALEYLERAYARNPEDSLAVVMLIATFARLGRVDDANRIVDDYPSPLSVNWTAGSFNFRNYEDWVHLSWGLRKGGMP